MTNNNQVHHAKAFCWPQWFNTSVADDSKIILPPQQIQQINQANLNIWDALNIFDDFLDQSGHAKDLPLAITKYRDFVTFFYELNLDKSFYTIFNNTLSDLDRANQHETQKYRLNVINGKIYLPNKLPDPEPLIKLSRKSLALALGPIAVLYLLYDKNAADKVGQVLKFFQFSLAAKQLADDSKDWYDDLQTGQLTMANRPIIEAALNSKFELDLKDSSGELHYLFAKHISLVITEQLISLCNQARKAAVKCGLAPNCILIKEIIGPIETSVLEVKNFRSWLEADLK